MELMTRRKRRTYSDEYKKQMVTLYLYGKSASEISKEYELTLSALRKWIQQWENSGSFRAKDNKTEEQLELERLIKENRKLKMENDILKQAVLIMGQK